MGNIVESDILTLLYTPNIHAKILFSLDITVQQPFHFLYPIQGEYLTRIYISTTSFWDRRKPSFALLSFLIRPQWKYKASPILECDTTELLAKTTHILKTLAIIYLVNKMIDLTLKYFKWACSLEKSIQTQFFNFIQ